jgi:quinate dehydrogenase
MQASHTQLEEPIPSPADLDGIAYLYGHPLRGSLSPLLHQTIFNALGLNWRQFLLSKSDTSSSYFPPPYTRSPPIDKFLATTRANPKFVGSSVTMPWKVSIMPYLDDLTEEAEQCGACNTIFLHEHPKTKRKIFVGTNTDCVGIMEALLQNRLSIYVDNNIDNPYHNKPAMIIGGGGTARAAIYALRKWLGCSKIYIINRDPAEISKILEEDKKRKPKHLASYAEIIPVTDIAHIHELEPPEAIISGIPNYAPKTHEEIRIRELIAAVLNQSNKGVMLEMCYHPRPWTDIAELASNAGWKVILGSEALLWQGYEQARLWTGIDIRKNTALIRETQRVVNKAIAERRVSLGKL